MHFQTQVPAPKLNLLHRLSTIAHTKKGDHRAGEVFIVISVITRCAPPNLAAKPKQAAPIDIIINALSAYIRAGIAAVHGLRGGFYKPSRLNTIVRDTRY